MRVFSSRAVAGLLVVVAVLAPAGAWAEDASQVWALRERYTFTLPGGNLLYNPADGEWAIGGVDETMIIESARTEVRLADGTALASPGAASVEGRRDRFTDALGTGNRVYAEAPLGHGLVMHHSLRAYNDRPFALLDVSVENRGETPVAVASISPAVIAPGKAAGLSRAAEAAMRPLRILGAHGVFDPASPGLAATVYDPETGTTLFVAALPWSPGRTEVRLERFEDQWQGAATCVYDPPVMLAPGQTLAADTLYISYGMRDWGQVCQNYAFVAGKVLPVDAGPTPPAWISAPRGATSQELLGAVSDWSGSGMRHVLIPYGWEGALGSYQGGPGYPRSMREFVQSLRGREMTVGLTVDPLATTSRGAGTIQTDDGQRWIDVATPEGRALAADQLAQTRAWGVGFFVVAPSAIPDEALRQLNITRVQAAHEAFAAAQAAAEGLPVLPASAGAPGGDASAWLGASAAVARMREYGLSAGPTTLNVANLDAIDEALHMALAFYSGPIELVGRPNRQVREAAARLVRRPVLRAYPLDFARPAPKLWRVSAVGPEGLSVGEGIVAFPGARAWSLTDPGLEGVGNAYVWTVTNGEFVVHGGAAVAAADRLQIHGVAPALSRPALMGAPMRGDLLLQEVVELHWDEAVGELSGRFAGKHTEAATAYVHFPEGWDFHRGRAGNAAMRTNGRDSVAFDIPAGQVTPFSLSFRRR